MVDSTKWVGLCHSASQGVKDVEVLVYNLFGAAAGVIYPQTTPKLLLGGCQLEQAETAMEQAKSEVVCTEIHFTSCPAVFVF